MSSDAFGTQFADVDFETQYDTQFMHPSKGGALTVQIQQSANQVIADNTDLTGAPAPQSQLRIAHTTAVRQPYHGPQGNTQVYMQQFSPALQPNDDTDYTKVTFPAFLTQTPSGFDSDIANLSGYDSSSFGAQGLTDLIADAAGSRPDTASTYSTSADAANVEPDLSAVHPVASVGDGDGETASGPQGATITVPGSNNALTYGLVL